MNFRGAIWMLVALTHSAHASTFFNDHARGWHWYETKPVIKADKKGQKKSRKTKHLASASQSKANPNDPSVILEHYRKLLKKHFDQALVNPTPQNLYTYMALQKDSMERSTRFANAWQQVVLQRPELDDTIHYPTSQVGRHVYYAQEKENIAAKIKSLKDTHGLYFFFKENCPYCHAFAPVVKAFATKHGWSVLAVSMDGSSLPEFPNAQVNNGMAQKLGVSMVPALFLANPAKGKILPISHGMISQQDIENRIGLLTSQEQL